MHSSPVFASSSYCELSPDGQLVAALNASALTVRSVKTLSLVNAIEISPGPVGAKTSFIWAPSSAKILVSIADQIQIFSVCDASFQVSVQNPVFSNRRPSSIHFGAVDTEVFVCSAVGLKFVILDLSTLKTVQVSNPKFFYPSPATRGFCLSPDTGHLALLTRANGKDFVSIHAPGSRRLQRSWNPNLVDAQGLIWAPDNRWLLLWESPAHAFRLLLYTPDGQKFRSIDALALSDSLSSASDLVFGAGIKACHLSPDAQLCVVSGYSRGIAVLDTQSWRECLKLLHPTAIIPRDTIQVWQEQLAAVDGKLALRPFVRAAMMVAPPRISSDAKKGKNAETGCSLAGFDASSTLLAARLDDSPGTIWIWDTAVAELRAVLIFYSHVSFTWHPARRELLLVTCQDEARRGTSFVWDPLSNGPVSVRPDDHLPPATAAGKPQLSWVSCDAELPKLLVADAEHYRLLALSGPEDEPNPWHDNEASDWSAESDDGTSALEDTFSFRKTELEGGSGSIEGTESVRHSHMQCRKGPGRRFA